MSGKLILFELKKVLKTKFTLFCVLTLLLLNVFPLEELLNYQKTRAQTDHATAGTGFLRYLSSGRELSVVLRGEYAVLAGLSPQEKSDFESAMKAKYGEAILEPDSFVIPTEEMLATPGYFGDSGNDLAFITDYHLLKRSNAEAVEAIDSVLEAAKAHGREALRTGDSYGVRRNLQIIRLYSVPRGEITSPIRGWERYLFDKHTMPLVFLLLLLILGRSFTLEQDSRTRLLLHTARYGKGRTTTAKYACGGLTAVSLTLLFRLTALGAVWLQDGLLGGEQPVTALEALRLCPYPFNIRQYALVSLGCQITAAIFWSVLLNSISAWCRSGIAAYGAGALLLGGCGALLYFPPRREWLAGPLALADPLRFFRSYHTASLFGYPVLWCVLLSALWAILGVFCMFTVRKVYHGKRRKL